MSNHSYQKDGKILNTCALCRNTLSLHSELDPTSAQGGFWPLVKYSSSLPCYSANSTANCPAHGLILCGTMLLGWCALQPTSNSRIHAARNEKLLQLRQRHTIIWSEDQNALVYPDLKKAMGVTYLQYFKNKNSPPTSSFLLLLFPMCLARCLWKTLLQVLSSFRPINHNTLLSQIV